MFCLLVFCFQIEISRRVTLEELPPVLVLHLKRFVFEKTGGCQKLIKNIDYPVDLEISKGIAILHRVYSAHIRCFQKIPGFLEKHLVHHQIFWCPCWHLYQPHTSAHALQTQSVWELVISHLVLPLKPLCFNGLFESLLLKWDEKSFREQEPAIALKSTPWRDSILLARICSWPK